MDSTMQSLTYMSNKDGGGKLNFGIKYYLFDTNYEWVLASYRIAKTILVIDARNFMSRLSGTSVEL